MSIVEPKAVELFECAGCGLGVRRPHHWTDSRVGSSEVLGGSCVSGQVGVHYGKGVNTVLCNRCKAKAYILLAQFEDEEISRDCACRVFDLADADLIRPMRNQL